MIENEIKRKPGEFEVNPILDTLQKKLKNRNQPRFLFFNLVEL